MPQFSPIPEDFTQVLFGEVFKKITNGGDAKMLGMNDFVAWNTVPEAIDKEAFDFAAKGFFGSVKKDENMTPQEYNIARSTKKWGAYIHSQEFSELVDKIPSNIPELNPDGTRGMTIWSDSLKRVSQVYEDALLFSTVLNTELDPKLLKKIETMRKKLFTIKKLANPEFDDTAIEHPEDNPKFIFQSFISPTYRAYLEYEIKYYAAEEELRNLEAAAQGGDDPQAITDLSLKGGMLKKKVTNAMKAWETLGYKTQVEKIQNYISQVEEGNFLTLKERYKTEFSIAKRTSVLTSNSYNISAPLPSNVLNNSDGWMEFKFDKSKYESSYSSKSNNWGANAGFKSPFWGASANINGSKTDISSKLDFNDFNMSFKIGKCSIIRGWLGMPFIESRYWRFPKTSLQVKNNQIISNGLGIKQNDGPEPLMPAIISEIYIIKDLNIGFTKGSSSYNFVESTIGGGGSVNIFGFNAGGHYNSSSKDVTATSEKTTQNQSAKGHLILGYKCHVVPLSPNPSPTIKDSEWTIPDGN
jgi:hypothetical protein